MTDASAAAGWAEALAEARARVAEVTTERDSLRSQVGVVCVDAENCRRRAEEAERGMMTAQARVADLRAAWWRWRLMLAALGPVARLRRRWPADPAEFDTPPLLGKPEG